MTKYHDLKKKIFDHSPNIIKKIFFQIKNRNNTIPRKKIVIGVHLVEHCNLKCKGCDNFSPLAAEEYVDVEQYEKDFKRMAYLFGDNAERIDLYGGEPLLHPRITDLLIITRESFPASPIEILTNGVLLTQMPEHFWKICFEQKIKISLTKYPVNLDYQKIESIVEKWGVEFEYHGYSMVEEKVLWKERLDPTGSQNATEMFKCCGRANNCIVLDKGRLYTCTMIPFVRHFNNFFNENIKVSEQDSIDIYKAKNAAEIFDFLSKPVPCCRYCDIYHNEYGIKWEQSRLDKGEWI